MVGIKAPSINAVINIRFPSVCKFIGVILVLGPCGGRISPVIPRGIFFTGVIPLLQDRAVPVEPTDMIFVQRPLCIEGAIPAKRDRRPIRIGRPGTVRRCVPAGKIIVRTGKGIGNQGCRRVWLHGLGTHAAIAAVGAEGNNRLLCPLRIKYSVFREGSGCPIIIGRPGTVRHRIPAGKGVVCISKAVTRQGDILSRRAALGGHRSKAAVGIKGNGDRRRFAAPSVVFIFDFGALRIVRRLRIAAVPIVQLGRGDGDRRIIWRPVVLNTLIGFAALARLALLNIYAGALAGADICAAFSGVNGSRRRQRAVDIDLRIDKVVLGAGIALTGRIRNGDKFLISCTTIVAPLLCIINIEVRAVRDLQLRALRDRHRNTRQQGSILADRCRSREDLHVHIVIDGEDIAR